MLLLGDGTISAKELEVVMRALGEPVDRQTLDLMIESVDTVRQQWPWKEK